MSGDAKIWRDIPDVHLTKELFADATIVSRHNAPQCGRYRIGTETQSDYGVEVRCHRRASIKIRLATGQYYDLCAECARLLGFREDA